MSYKTRSARRISKNTKRKLILTIIFILFIFYATLNWILPTLIDGLGTIRGVIKPSTNKRVENIADQQVLAPPILNIPFEATNTAQINISGYTQAATKVKIYLDDNLRTKVDTESDGSFVAKNIELLIGTNNIYAKTVKDSKESLPSKTFKVIYDRDRPNLSVSEPVDNKEIQGGLKQVKIAGKTNPDAYIFVNGSKIIINSDGTFSTDININEGENMINIKAQDAASNITEVTRKVIYKP